MNRNSFSVCFAVALTLIFSSITASAQQPRAIPSNDNFISSTPIQIGKSYTVPDIAAATNETGEPTASCRSAAVIPNSVWFAFTAPETSRIYFTTFGSVFTKPESYSTDTVLAVYELTSPGVFTEQACNDDANSINAAQLIFHATADTTYYIVAGSYFDQPYLPDSTLKLSSRMLSTAIYPPNFSFETAVNGTDWKVKNGGDDMPVCSNTTYIAVQGLCAFRFIGTPGITTKLTHTIPFPDAYLPRKNALLSYLIYVRVADTTSLGPTKIRFIVTYSNGTPRSIHTVDLTGTPTMTDYLFLNFPLTLTSSKVASIKLDVKFASSTGTLLLDYLNYYYLTDISLRSGGLLPMPAAAK